MARLRSHLRILAWLQPSPLAALAVLTGGTFALDANAQVPAPGPAVTPPGWSSAPAPVAPSAVAPRAVAPVSAAPIPAAPSVAPPSGDDDGGPAETATADAPKAEPSGEARARTLAEQANLLGSTGLLRTSYAGSGAAGTFRVGFLADWFSSSGFLCNANTPCDPAAQKDEASHIGGWFTLNATPLSFLEAYVGLRTYANSNSLGTPTLLQVLGDTTLGLKAFTPSRIGDLLTVGGEARVYFLNGAGDVGVAGSGTSADLSALASFDFRELEGRGIGAPLRVHFNVGYQLNNSGKLVEDVERLRGQRNPSILEGTTLDRIPISRIERYGLGINRVDFLPVRVGIDVPLRWVQPYVEYGIDIPVNRQGYECHTRTISEGDVCLALKDLADPQSGPPGFAAAPSRVTVGARTNPLDGNLRGLSAHAAFDLGVSGTKTFIEEVAPQAPWTLYLGLGYAFDVVEKAAPAPVAPPAAVPVALPPPPPEVIPPPAEYFVRGTVKEKGAAALVAKAIVTLKDPGASEPPYATDASGKFLTRRLEPGAHTFEISAEGYKTGTCTGTIVAATPAAMTPAPAPAAPTPTVPGGQPPAAPAPLAPPPKAYVTGSFFTDLSCELESLPKKGGVAGTVTSSAGGKGVGGATVTLIDSTGGKHNATTGADGSFQFGELPPGEGSLRAEAPGHFAHQQDVNVRPREDVKAGVTLTKRPLLARVKVAGNQIQISKQIHFESDSAVIADDSSQLLEEIADVMNRNSNFQQIEIQGHTDNTGTAQRNKDLSQGRADAVRAWLVEKGGVDAARLTSKGYGQDRPLVPNVTPTNRARNRRVQFVIQKK